MLLNIKCVLRFSLQLLSDAFLSLRRIQWDIIINVRRYSRKVSVILVGCYWNLSVLDWFSKDTQISSCMKVCPVRDDLSHADGQTRVTKLTVAYSCFANLPLTRKMLHFTTGGQTQCIAVPYKSMKWIQLLCRLRGRRCNVAVCCGRKRRPAVCWTHIR